MCGIAGFFLKSGGIIPGAVLMEMLKQIPHRGSDSSGVALLANPRENIYYCRISFRDEGERSAAENMLAARSRVLDCFVEKTNSPYLVLSAVLEGEAGEIGRLYGEINGRPGLCVHSLSQSLVVIKDIGRAGQLAGCRLLGQLSATHGIGHVRLATESIDNLNFAHPFTSQLYPALAIVHNGQLTNYFNLRRTLERKGIVFKTANDSELIAHYLAFRVAVEGKSFQEALECSVEDLDGVYSYLAVTESAVGAVQDRLGLKPILVCEMPEMVLFGSERTCFSPLNIESGKNWEIKPGEARVWSH